MHYNNSNTMMVLYIYTYFNFNFSFRDKEGTRGQQPPPLLRSSTLPAIIVPGLNILHAQIGPSPTPNGIYLFLLFSKLIFIDI